MSPNFFFVQMKVSSSSIDLGITSYNARASVLIEQANYELENQSKTVDNDPACICIV